MLESKPFFPGRRVLRLAVGLAAASTLIGAGASSALAAGRVYWSNHNNNTIGFANADGSGGGGTLNTSGAPISAPFGTVIDSTAGRLYWVNEFGSSIVGYAALDGSGGGSISTAGSHNGGAPTGAAIDPVTHRIYWGTQNPGHAISFANLDGSGGGDLNTAGAPTTDACGVAIDPVMRRIYWANYYGTGIDYANLDGSGGGALSTTGATLASQGICGVTIDTRSRRIYWLNPHGPASYAQLDGSGGGNLAPATIGGCPWGPVVDPSSNELIWGEYCDGAVRFERLDGTASGALNIAGANPSGPSWMALVGSSAPVAGTVSARGTVTDSGSHPVSLSARTDCTAASSTRPLIVQFGSTRFTKTAVTSSGCSQDSGVGYSPASGFNTQTGTATGSLSTGGTATISWKFVDGGAGASPADKVSFTITQGGTTLVSVASQTPGSLNGSPGGVWTFAPQIMVARSHRVAHRSARTARAAQATRSPVPAGR